jgi:dihydrofolate reductase
MTYPLILVVALADNGVIGRDNRLLWRLRTDLRRFRELTWGKPMIMGRKTFESIGKPLPGRETIVLTRNPAFRQGGVHVARSWDEAVERGQAIAERMGADAVAIAGGAEIYAIALPHVQKMYLTQVHASPAGDAIFPSFDRSAFREVRRRDHPQGPDDEHPFTFIDLERRSTDASR